MFAEKIWMATIAESLSEFILGTWKEICETLHGANNEGNKKANGKCKNILWCKRGYYRRISKPLQRQYKGNEQEISTLFLK